MQKRYFVGNLKMNLLSREEARQYLAILSREAAEQRFKHVVGILCPPALYLSDFDHLPEGILKGAQDASWEKSGAYTGEISPLMLKNDGVDYVIIGHSERRLYNGENDELIRAKAEAAIKYHLSPIVCVGESREERENGKTEAVLEQQLQAVFRGLSRLQAEKVILAYEPRWAVGTDILPETGEIMQAKVLLRKKLSELHGQGTAERIPVLYGGSVKSSFLGAVSWEAGMDGVLVGRESLFPYEVVKMMGLLEERSLAEKEQEGK